MTTPFEKAGYTKDTKFKVLTDYSGMRKGDIVILEEDDGSTAPYFTKEGCSNFVEMYLPDQGNELEVYEEQSDNTPVTRNTKINVEMTVEEAIGVVEILDNIGGKVNPHRVVIDSAGNKIDDALEEAGVDRTFNYEYYEFVGIDIVPTKGSFNQLLDKLVPLSQEKQNTLNEIEELRNKLAELEKKVEGMD